jgi:hypothetical protein
VNYAQLLFPDFSLILSATSCAGTRLNRSVWQPVESLVYYLPVSGAAVPVHREEPAGPWRRVGPDRRGPDDGLSRALRWPTALPHLPWLGTRIDRRDHAASAQVAFRFNSFIGAGAGRAAGRRAGPAADCGADRRLRAAVQRGRRLADGAPWQRGFLRELVRNPLIMATASGLVANLLGFRIARLA